LKKGYDLYPPLKNSGEDKLGMEVWVIIEDPFNKKRVPEEINKDIEDIMRITKKIALKFNLADICWTGYGENALRFCYCGFRREEQGDKKIS
jgi:hypothetical protein